MREVNKFPQNGIAPEIHKLEWKSSLENEKENPLICLKLIVWREDSCELIPDGFPGDPAKIGQVMRCLQAQYVKEWEQTFHPQLLQISNLLSIIIIPTHLNQKNHAYVGKD